MAAPALPCSGANYWEICSKSPIKPLIYRRKPYCNTPSMRGFIYIETSLTMLLAYILIKIKIKSKEIPMTTFRFILGCIVCTSLPIVSIGVVNATEGGDATTVFKDSSSSSAVKREEMTVERGAVEQNFTESLTVLPSSKTCNISTRQVMNLHPENYRWHNEDVNDSFVDPNYIGHTLKSAKLCIKYNDVDFTSTYAYTPELNVVQLGSTTLDVLPGNNGKTLEKCWDVKPRLQQNTRANIPFIINVDAAHDINYWAVYLHHAKLSTCHQRKIIFPPILPPSWPPVDIRSY